MNNENKDRLVGEPIDMVTPISECILGVTDNNFTPLGCGGGSPLEVHLEIIDYFSASEYTYIFPVDAVVSIDVNPSEGFEGLILSAVYGTDTLILVPFDPTVVINLPANTSLSLVTNNLNV